MDGKPKSGSFQDFAGSYNKMSAHLENKCPGSTDQQWQEGDMRAYSVTLTVIISAILPNPSPTF